jgi:predicted amidohydrolase
MKVAAIQHDIVWEDAERTRKKVAPLIAQAAVAGARLIVLTEMYATGFSMQPERIAEHPGGANEQFLVDQAREHGSYLVGSIAQWDRADGRARNVAVVAQPSGEVQRYAKIHPFSYVGEDKHYAAGTQFLTVDVVANGESVRVSPFVCYDLRFADEFWARAASRTLAHAATSSSDREPGLCGWCQPGRHGEERSLRRGQRDRGPGRPCSRRGIDG